ncbi:MAG: TatD family hydrolase [Planctomycetaceae bacterium]
MAGELIDTHAHLDEAAFDSDCEQVVQRAIEAGVTRIITIGTTAASSQRAVELAHRFEPVSAAVGIQPNYVSDAQPADWSLIERLVTDTEVVAVGETGLDRYWDYAPIELQREFFTRHVELARAHDLPFVVHCREAEEDIVTFLRDARQRGPLRGVMHSFCGSLDTARHCLELGLHISFAGMLTFKKNDELRKIAAEIPADRLLVETDAPYLAPLPKRGKRNEPALVRHTADCLAGARETSAADLAAQVTANAVSLFRL